MKNRQWSIKDEIEKLEQLEHRKRLQDNRERMARRKNDDRRIFMVGKIFLDAFPEFLNLQPQKSAEADEHEFAPLKNFLAALAADKELVKCLKSEAVSIKFKKEV